MKYRLQVTAHALNKRNRIPAAFPDEGGIVGVVLQGFSFVGERVLPAELNGTTERWYRDRDGYFYMGRWLIETEEIPSLQVVREVKVAPVKAGPPVIQMPSWMTDLEIDKIWEKTQGDNVVVAVLDSGYNSTVADLEDAVIDSKVFMQVINDVVIPVEDTFGHGTHCASLVAARNKMNITACAPQAGLLIGKITSSGGVSSYENIILAIEWAIEKNADVISISYGGTTTHPALEAIITKAVNEHNIAVVAAIGNKIEFSTNKPQYPAMFKDCIAVGAVNQQKQMAPFTIQNAKTEINAPGENIPGYWLAELKGKNGTSQATAIVAGLIALIISRYKKIGKAYTVKSILDLIRQTSDPVVGLPEQRRIMPLKIFEQI